ncbi:uncharacterized protein KY384_004218 [Bacidia gigantensis]|uniref:uncharacterized protein n=1 Tax=Bacidia gigantensis TaxID=2732470 RepID=UPI001D044908|nr:uncharacterized protein KY384_004218 [Bacidia gigantensis]KAG8530861.1 hypothetical protein KY384_004218 [Bacidia gigantensis]
MAREPTSSTGDEIEVVSRAAPRARSRCSIVVDEFEDPPPPRKRSTSNIRVVKSRRQRRPVYAEEPEMWPRRRRYRSGSHVSFVDEPDEVIVSHSRKSSRAPRVYYDGANSGQYEFRDQADILATPDDNQSNGSDHADSIEMRWDQPRNTLSLSHDTAETLNDCIRLIDIRSEREESSIPPSRPFADSSVFAHDLEIGSDDNSQTGDAADLCDTAHVESVREDEKEASAITHTMSSRTENMRIQSDQQHSQASQLMQARNDGNEGHLLAGSDEKFNRFQTSDRGSSSNDSFCRLSFEAEVLMPSNDPAHPDHPDHVCWLIASDHIAPVGRPEGGIGYVDNEASFSSSGTAEPAMPLKNDFNDAWIELSDDGSQYNDNCSPTIPSTR